MKLLFVFFILWFILFDLILAAKSFERFDYYDNEIDQEFRPSSASYEEESENSNQENYQLYSEERIKDDTEKENLEIKPKYEINSKPYFENNKNTTNYYIDLGEVDEDGCMKYYQQALKKVYENFLTTSTSTKNIIPNISLSSSTLSVNTSTNLALPESNKNTTLPKIESNSSKIILTTKKIITTSSTSLQPKNTTESLIKIEFDQKNISTIAQDTLVENLNTNTTYKLANLIKEIDQKNVTNIIQNLSTKNDTEILVLKEIEKEYFKNVSLQNKTSIKTENSTNIKIEPMVQASTKNQTLTFHSNTTPISITTNIQPLTEIKEILTIANISFNTTSSTSTKINHIDENNNYKYNYENQTYSTKTTKNIPKYTNKFVDENEYLKNYYQSWTNYYQPDLATTTPILTTTTKYPEYTTQIYKDSEENYYYKRNDELDFEEETTKKSTRV